MIEKLSLLPPQETINPPVPLEVALNPYFAKLNEVIDALNALQNHYHISGESQHPTSYLLEGRVSELHPRDGS